MLLQHASIALELENHKEHLAEQKAAHNELKKLSEKEKKAAAAEVQPLASSMPI